MSRGVAETAAFPSFSPLHNKLGPKTPGQKEAIQSDTGHRKRQMSPSVQDSCFARKGVSQSVQAAETEAPHGWLKQQTRMSPRSGDRKLEIRAWACSVLGQPHFLVCRRSSIPLSSWRTGRSSVGLFHQGTDPIPGAPPSRSNHPGPLLTPSRGTGGGSQWGLVQYMRGPTPSWPPLLHVPSL